MQKKDLFTMVCLFLFMTNSIFAQSSQALLESWMWKLEKGEYVEKSSPSKKEQKLLRQIFGQPSDSLKIHYVRFDTSIKGVPLVNESAVVGREIVIGKISSVFYVGFLYRTPHPLHSNHIPFVIGVKDSLIYLPGFNYIHGYPQEKYSFRTLESWSFLDFKGNSLGWYRQYTPLYEFDRDSTFKEYEPLLYHQHKDSSVSADKEYPLVKISPLDFARPVSYWFSIYKKNRQLDRNKLPDRKSGPRYPSLLQTKDLPVLFGHE